MATHPRALALAFFAAVIPALGQSSRLTNLSARTTIPVTGVSLSFVITGAASKTVLVRAVGPGLTAFGVPGAVSDPQVTVTNAAGTTVASNDNWGTDAAVTAAAMRVGAFALASGSLDAAAVMQLPPGTYTATARGVGGTVGTLLLEVYDADSGMTLSAFSTLSFRGPTGPGAETLVAGVVVSGGTAPLLIRALGPALAAAGVSGAAADPVMTVFNTTGTIVGTNDNWNNDTIVAELSAQAGALPLAPNSKDSALLINGSGPTITAQVLSPSRGTAQIEFINTAAFAVAPVITSQPPSRVITPVGSSTSLTVTALAYPAPTYQWFKDGVAIAGATSATLAIGSVKASDAGSYTVAVKNSAATITSSAGQLIIGPTAWLSNLSVRTRMTEGQTLMMGAVVVGGPRDLLFRAAGPALVGYGVSPVLADPKLAVFDDRGLKVNENDNWNASLASTFTGVGAFAFGANSKDAAVVQTVNGSGTLQVTGTGAGIVLVESYDLGEVSVPRMANLSVRGRSGTQDDVLIAGFTIRGQGTQDVLVRGVGPALVQFGVSGVLADPKLEIYDSAKNLVAQNENWSAIHASVMASVGAFSLPPGSNDAAAVVTLPPGSYTAVVRGADGGIGEALIEIYEVR